jgi:hypothetical protein
MTVFQGIIFGSTSEAQNSFVCPFKSCLLQVVHSDYNGCDSVQNWTAFFLWHFQFLSLCFSLWGIKVILGARLQIQWLGSSGIVENLFMRWHCYDMMGYTLYYCSMSLDHLACSINDHLMT